MRTHTRRVDTCLAALAGLVLLASAGTTAQPFPDLIPLPADFGPEGIAVGNGTTFYAGSLAASTRGQILVGDLRTGEVATLVEPDGVPALGMKYHSRSNLLFVARSSSGAGTVFDAASGEIVAQYNFQTAPTFVNDVVVTREAAYFTDTQAPFLYRVELDRLAARGRRNADSASQHVQDQRHRRNAERGASLRRRWLDGPAVSARYCHAHAGARRSRRRHAAECGRTVARRQDAVRRAEFPQQDRCRRPGARLSIGCHRALHHGTIRVESIHESADHHCGVRRCAVRRDGRLRGPLARFRGATDEVSGRPSRTQTG